MSKPHRDELLPCLPSKLSRASAVGWPLVILLAASFFVTGCTRQVRHELLTIFFTGVPPLEDPQVKSLHKNGKPAVSIVDMAGGGRRNPTPAPAQDGQPPIVEVPRFYSHTVWAEGRCAACHEGTSLFVFQSGAAAGKNAANKVFHSGGGMPGALRQPKDKLCLACHRDKAGLRAIKDNLWLHNTTAKGACLTCHDAHQSSHRGVLRKPSDQICLTCHHTEKLKAIPMHREGNEPCLSCHNPHMGKDRHLLRADYQEVKQAAGREL